MGYLFLFHLSLIFHVHLVNVLLFAYFILLKLMVAWLGGWVLWLINLCRLVNAKAVYMPKKSVLFQTIQFSMSTQFNCQKPILFQAIQFSQTFLFQTIQFSISMQFSSVWPIDRTLFGATTLGRNRPESDESEELLRIPQSSSITGNLPSDCFVPHIVDALCSLSPLQRSSQCILQPQPIGQAKTEVMALRFFYLLQWHWYI